MDTNDPFTANYPAPTATRPLLGLTVLVVEGSRYACEAMRSPAYALVRGSDGLIASAPPVVIFKSIALLSWLWTWVCLMETVPISLPNWYKP